MTTPSDIHTLARAAADAVTRLCATLDDCAREVSAPVHPPARRMLGDARLDAEHAIEALYFIDVVDDASPIGRELCAMIAGCRYGYVRASWALRIMAIAGEVEAVAPAGEMAATGAENDT